MHVLVTGGAGFIGSNYVEHLLQSTTAEITTLDALTYAGSRSNLPLDADRHRFVEGSITDSDLVAELVEPADVIVNFAAESHVDRSIEGSEDFVRTNVGGVQTLCEAALDSDLERFVQMSTDEVYGQILDGKAEETDPLEPRNPYAATKAGADLLLQSYYTTHGLPAVIIRASNNFGPRQHREKLIPKLITRATDGEYLPIYGDGLNIREWMYVADTCRAVEHVRQHGEVGQIYNAGSGEELQNVSVAEKIVDAVGADPDLITFVSDRPGHDQRYALETSRIRDLGWHPEWSFDEGLEATVQYYT